MVKFLSNIAPVLPIIFILVISLAFKEHVNFIKYFLEITSGNRLLRLNLLEILQRTLSCILCSDSFGYSQDTGHTEFLPEGSILKDPFAISFCLLAELIFFLIFTQKLPSSLRLCTCPCQVVPLTPSNLLTLISG